MNENELVVIGNNVRTDVEAANLVLQKGYTVENALKSAYLTLRETKDRNNKPVLDVCTPESIHYALLDMIVQGLNPLKDQCYFVAYGKKLTCMRSYMGSMMLAKSVDDRISDIRCQLVYQGDEFSFVINNGRKIIKDHFQSLENIDDEKIIGGYVLSVDDNDNVLHSDLMTIAEIKKSWQQSQLKPVNADGSIKENSTHGKFGGEMAKRTIINRLCKKIINTSDDINLVTSSNRSDEIDGPIQSIDSTVIEHANTVPLDFDDSQESDKPAIEVDMATKSHAKVIFDLSKQLNRSKTIIPDLTGHMGRKIEGISQLTAKEAEEYIEMLEHDLQKISDDTPNWA